MTLPQGVSPNSAQAAALGVTASTESGNPTARAGTGSTGSTTALSQMTASTQPLHTQPVAKAFPALMGTDLLDGSEIEFFVELKQQYKTPFNFMPEVAKKLFEDLDAASDAIIKVDPAHKAKIDRMKLEIEGFVDARKFNLQHAFFFYFKIAALCTTNQAYSDNTAFGKNQTRYFWRYANDTAEYTAYTFENFMLGKKASREYDASSNGPIGYGDEGSPSDFPPDCPINTYVLPFFDLDFGNKWPIPLCTEKAAFDLTLWYKMYLNDCFPIGIPMGISEADGEDLSPIAFFNHDLDHLRDDMDVGLDKFPAYKVQYQDILKTIYEHTITFKKIEKLKKWHSIMFELTHEKPLDINNIIDGKESDNPDAQVPDELWSADKIGEYIKDNPELVEMFQGKQSHEYVITRLLSCMNTDELEDDYGVTADEFKAFQTEVIALFATKK